MSEASSQSTASARNFEGEILRRLAKVRNEVVAGACQRDESWVSKLAAGETGLRLLQIQPFLQALGLKVVAVEKVCIDRHVIEAYRTLAKAAMVEPDSLRWDE